MRRRFVQSTVIAVILSVLMLGIPLAIAWQNVVSNDLSRDVGSRLDRVSQVVEQNQQMGLPLTAKELENYAYSPRGLHVYIYVFYPDGTSLRVGKQVKNSGLTKSRVTTHGANVTVAVPESDVYSQTATAWALIIGASAFAVAIGVVAGYWQARRLSEPLAQLSRRAKEIGSGRTRSTWEPSNIAEIDGVALELSRSASRLSERLAVERRLASDASHQLRTPLTALSMRLEEILHESTEEYVQSEARIAIEQVERLTQVVHDLINAPRSSDRRSPEVVDVSEILKQQKDEWQRSFSAQHRVLDIAPGRNVMAWASSGPLAQVVATLVENSLVHGDGRTTVRLRVSPQSVVIEVRDEGPGIPEELGKLVFERSVSGPDSPGTGVGLALARDLVADDGGRLELINASPPVFGVFLKAAPAPEEKKARGIRSIRRPSLPGVRRGKNQPQPAASRPANSAPESVGAGAAQSPQESVPEETA